MFTRFGLYPFHTCSKVLKQCNKYLPIMLLLTRNDVEPLLTVNYASRNCQHLLIHATYSTWSLPTEGC